jgi:hypothetical protein
MDQVGSTCVLYKSSSQYVLKSKSCSHSLTRSDTYSSREMETDREKKSEGSNDFPWTAFMTRQNFHYHKQNKNRGIRRDDCSRR